MTKVCDKHFEELALWEGEFLDTLSEEVLLVHGEAVLLPPDQLPLDPPVYEGRLGGGVRLQVLLILLLNVFDNEVQHVIFQAHYLKNVWETVQNIFPTHLIDIISVFEFFV